LKVFWLKKYSEEIESLMYRSCKPPKNIASVKIKNNSPFKWLTVTNPKDSNCIYTIHDLQINSNGKGILRVLGNDNFKMTPAPLKTDKLLISHDLHLNLGYIELASAKDRDNLFQYNYAIILPGGSLIVETEKNTCELDLSINWSVEEF
jgi:hypothetical protein